ncbi:MAG: hypothetical protein WCK02_09660 [Bacteroidota bacterium]
MDSNSKNEMQLKFLGHIEDLIPSTSSLVNELSDVLEISIDSAYRRMRGETSLTIDEIIKICNNFRISFDSFTSINNGIVTFHYNVIKNEEKDFMDYLIAFRDDLKKINLSKNKQIVYACKDTPVFQNYNYPELAAFKMFYWMKSNMNITALENVKFDISKISEELKKIGQEIFDLYTQIPSIEIWTDSTISSIIKQIEFYWESGMFHSREDALAVCSALHTQMIDIQKQAECSNKEKKSNINNYSLFYSEIEITNNCVLVSINENRAVYIGHQSFNSMKTTNKSYCEESEVWLNNIIKTSTLISGVSEKHRYQFFKNNLKKIEYLIGKI